MTTVCILHLDLDLYSFKEADKNNILLNYSSTLRLGTFDIYKKFQ